MVAKTRKTLYTVAAVLVMVSVWVAIYFYPSPEFDAAVERLGREADVADDFSHLVMLLSIKEGEAEVRFRNAGEKHVVIPDEAAGRAYGFIVSGEGGFRDWRPVSATEAPVVVRVELVPGAEYARRFDLERLLGLGAGSYSVRAVYAPPLIDQTHQGTRLESNEAAYEITRE